MGCAANREQATLGTGKAALTFQCPKSKQAILGVHREEDFDVLRFDKPSRENRPWMDVLQVRYILGEDMFPMFSLAWGHWTFSAAFLVHA